MNSEIMDADALFLSRGVAGLWKGVNHIAIVVNNVGTSLAFYTDIVGMQQVRRPNFDR
jgi:catechol-2,3-dioxygenase